MKVENVAWNAYRIEGGEVLDCNFIELLGIARARGWCEINGVPVNDSKRIATAIPRAKPCRKRPNPKRLTGRLPFETAPGDIISAANTWPSKWHRTFYRVSEDGTEAVPFRRAFYWCDQRGEVEEVTDEPARPLTYGANYETLGQEEFGFNSLPMHEVRKETPGAIPELTNY